MLHLKQTLGVDRALFLDLDSPCAVADITLAVSGIAANLPYANFNLYGLLNLRHDNLLRR